MLITSSPTRLVRPPSPGAQRRGGPRVTVESLCSEVHAAEMRHALVVDVSEGGLCLERPIGGPRTRRLQLELELPGMDEIVWALGEITFDEVKRGGQAAGGGLIRKSGVRLVEAARRHQRMLREYVFETYAEWTRARDDADLDRPRHDPLLDASCYLRG